MEVLPDLRPQSPPGKRASKLRSSIARGRPLIRPVAKASCPMAWLRWRPWAFASMPARLSPFAGIRFINGLQRGRGHFSLRSWLRNSPDSTASVARGSRNRMRGFAALGPPDHRVVAGRATGGRPRCLFTLADLRRRTEFEAAQAGWTRTRRPDPLPLWVSPPLPRRTLVRLCRGALERLRPDVCDAGGGRSGVRCPDHQPQRTAIRRSPAKLSSARSQAGTRHDHGKHDSARLPHLERLETCSSGSDRAHRRSGGFGRCHYRRGAVHCVSAGDRARRRDARRRSNGVRESTFQNYSPAAQDGGADAADGQPALAARACLPCSC